MNSTYFSWLPRDMLAAELAKPLEPFYRVKFWLSMGCQEEAQDADNVLYIQHKDFFDKLLAKQFFRVIYKDGYIEVTITKYYNICCNIIELDCNGHQLKSLPPLLLVKKLNCWNNQLKSLPELPLVTELNCGYTQLTKLPELPFVTELSCYNNQLKSLPPLPLVKKLSCFNNQLTSLPELPLV